MKTIIDWFLNLDSIVNITPSSFWWIVIFIAMPYIIFVLKYFSAEKYKGFWVFASAVYAVFAMSWCINLGWKMKVNQYQKQTNTIDMNISIDQPIDTLSNNTDSVTVELQYSTSADSAQNITNNRVKTVKVPLNVYHRSRTNHHHHYNHH